MDGSGGMDMYTVQRPACNPSQTERFPALESDEGLEKRGPNVWKFMSVILACLAAR